MSFDNTKELFLSSRTDSFFYDSSIATYKRKIDVFFEFLTEEFGVNENNYKEVLRGIDKIAITKSIDFYVKRYSISFKNTIDLYISVIKSYFEFLNKHLDIKNDNFDSAINLSVIKNAVDNKIVDLGLETTELKSPITEQAFSKILNKCHQILNGYNLKFLLENKGKPRKNPVQIFTSAIVTKLVMLTGIKNQVIDTIKLKDYDSELNIIKVNNFSIHLPNNLGIQMKLYLELRNCIAKSNDGNYPLFVKRDGTSIGNAYEYIFKVLRDTLGSASAECVAKYTIMQMIKKGMNLYLIKMLTKFGIDSCLHCQELVNDEKTNEDITSQNRYIDSKIRSMDVFDIL
ncbi:hypothetical protein M3649_19345 [Ureibacillus chungkukjangi]|nr:hypothetical protein [Ureibacillus chungkukjangi]